jgi:tetratricopeptide (TPR) repeat protein
VGFTKFGIIRLLLLINMGVVSTVAQVHSVSEPVEIRGQVRFAAGGAPVANVLVRLEALSGGSVNEEITDRQGRFRFSGLFPVQYFVIVRLAGYLEVRREVNLIMQASDYIQIQLAPDNVQPETSPKTTKLVDAKVPPEARSEFEKAETLLEQKKLDEGISHLEKAIAIYPDFPEAQLQLGTAYMDAKQWEEAERVLKRASEIAPASPNAFFALGELYLQQKKYPAAETVLRQGLKIENRSWRGHFALGRVYWAKGDVSQAGKQIALTLQLNPDFADAHLLAGNILLRAGKPDDAKTEFETYLQLEPKGEFANQVKETLAKMKTSH